MKFMKWVAKIAKPFEFKRSLLGFREVLSKDELSINLTLCFSDMVLIFLLTSLTFCVESMSCLDVTPDIPRSFTLVFRSQVIRLRFKFCLRNS